ncbi:MAG: hypothetical protein LBD59_00725 [Prevotellaceae bacterium]|nr:hypothetical protein [Prevotellaceae bacterium]
MLLIYAENSALSQSPAGTELYGSACPPPQASINNQLERTLSKLKSSA